MYVTIFMVALLGLLSLAVDWGRVQNAESELQTAVDAAARYAVSGLSDGTYLTKAQSVASQNLVDGSPLILQNQDIQPGWWDAQTKTFNPSASTVNAVRVTGIRSRNRNTAVPTTLAQVIGLSSVNLQAISIAVQSSSAPAYRVVGLDGINFSGTARIEPNTGETNAFVVASNGNWNASSSNYVDANIHYRNTPPTISCSGSKTLMPANLSYSQPTTPSGTISLGNVNWSGNTTLPGGNYSANSINISGGTITLTGDVNLYVSGNFSVSGSTLIQTNGTSNKLRIYLTVASGFNYNASNPLYAAVYAPTSPANINSGQIIGSLIAKSINLSGNAKIRYDSDLDPPTQYAPSGGSGSGGSSGGICTVY